MVSFFVNTFWLEPYRLLQRRGVPGLMYLLSFLRNHRHPVWSWPETVPALLPRVAVFVHFDRRGAVQAHVLHYLEALRRSGCSVLFVTNAERLQPEALEAIKPVCHGILIRKNIGYDFGALREAIEHYNLPHQNTEMLILANDSVYGPFTPLDGIFDQVDFAKADIWGVTDSWQYRYHLQSFLLMVGPNAMRHPAWKGFWSRVRPVASKAWVIRHYEIGFTQWMIRAGLRCAALWPYSALVRSTEAQFETLNVPPDATVQADPVAKQRLGQIMSVRSAFARRTALNPTADLWRSLLRNGFPFIKRELLRDNPGQIQDVVDWPDEVALLDPGHLGIIEADLKRTLRDRAP